MAGIGGAAVLVFLAGEGIREMQEGWISPTAGSARTDLLTFDL